MFTGLIEEIGVIQAIQKNEKSLKLTIRASKITDFKIGDSISTNGVCLTASKIFSSSFEADVMAETIRKSNLGSLKIGDRVNLERALKYEGRLGGHIVTGHIDGTGTILNYEKEDNAVWVTVKANEKILRYVIEKGSIAIDGISLTVAYVDSEMFKVSIIPHTGEETILLHKAKGDIVNLECDIIGKYVEKLLGLSHVKEEKNKNKVDLDFLKNNGFI